MRNRSSQASRALVLLAVLSAAPAFAQGLAVLTGTVNDAATRQPVADVVVTATSPGLQGEQIVVTDASGNYRIPQLPPGTYTLRLEKESFKPYSRADIVLRASRTIRVNIELLPEALKAEEVVVVGKAPTIDVGSSSTGYTVSSDFVRNIAVNRPSGRGGAARSFESLAEVAPQTQGDLYGVSINGTTSPENGYLIDGLSVSDPGFGLLGTPLSSEFVQEVNIVTGGYLPEFGRSTGGVMSVTTKKGSNEFRGSLFSTFTPGALVGNPREVPRAGSVVSTTSQLHNVGDMGLELGGPILKDKLWFFVGIAPNIQRYKVTRTFNRLVTDDTGALVTDDNGFTRTERIPGTGQEVFADQRSLQYIAKLTYAINENHTLNLQTTGTPTRGGGKGKLDFDIQNGGAPSNLSGNIESLGYSTVNDSYDVVATLNSSFFEKRLLVDTTVGWHNQNIVEQPSDGSRVGSADGLAGTPALSYRRTPGTNRDFHNILDFTGPGTPGYDGLQQFCDPANPENLDADGRTRCPVTSWRTGGPGFVREGKLDRYQGKIIATLLVNALGQHVFKAGLDLENTRFDSTRAYTGRVALRERVTGNGWDGFRNYSYLTAPGEATFLDAIRTTVSSQQNGVFLQDSWNILNKVTVNAGLRYDTQTLYGGDGRAAFSLPTQLSPRVGAIYDFTQEGRSKIYVNYARYYQSVPLNIADRGFGNEKQTFYRAARDPAACDPQNNPESAKTACQDPANFLIPPFTLSADRTVVDPALKPQSSDEIVAGGEFMVVPDGRLGLVYTRRSLIDVIEDMSRDEAATYFLGNPGQGLAADFPRATREYDAITVFFDKTFSDGWMGQVSYTLSRLYGNYNGLFVASTGQIDPNSNATFDLVSLLDNQTGPLEADRTHQLKAFGAKQFVLNSKMAMTLGGSYTGSSGTPINYLGSHAIYGADEAYVLQRGSGGRTPFIHRIDTRLSYDYRLTDTNVVSASVDVFNLFNFQGATAVDNRYTNADVQPVINGTPPQGLDKVQTVEGEPLDAASVNPNFKNVTQYQAARNVRFGLRVTF